MVLNNHKPYDSDSLDNEGDPWEMIGCDETETLPLAASQIPTAVPDDDADNQTENNAERESQLETDEAATMNDENEERHDGNVSCVSGVSSITGDHHSVSDVEEEEESFDATQNNTPSKTNREYEPLDALCELVAPNSAQNPEETVVFTAISEGDDDYNEEGDTPDDEQDTPTITTPSDSPDTDAEKSEDGSDPLVEQISQMGFDKEQIEKAIGDLREAGATEIDADSVIGSMLGDDTNNNPTHPFQVPLSSTWDFVESSVRDLDNQHQLRRRSQNCAQTIGRSARELWSNVKDESQRFQSNLRETCDQADVQARNTKTQARYAASSAKDSFCRANEEYGILEKVATVAVIGGATLLALGNPRAGVSAMAVAGASLAAGEAMKHSSTQSGSTYTGDHGLDEGVHLD